MYLSPPRQARRPEGARYWGRAEGTIARLLLILGAVALLIGVPLLWSWLLNGSNLRSSAFVAAGIGLCVLTAAIGAAMIRLLDGGR